MARSWCRFSIEKRDSYAEHAESIALLARRVPIAATEVRLRRRRRRETSLGGRERYSERVLFSIHGQPGLRCKIPKALAAVMVAIAVAMVHCPVKIVAGVVAAVDRAHAMRDC